MVEKTAANYAEARLPRYTSYPTAPHFAAAVDGRSHAEWLQAIPEGEAVSLYLHVPFCRALCWYCGCHTSITAKTAPVTDYVGTLTREIELVAGLRRQGLDVGEIHFGGGTPTILQPQEFTTLMATLRDRLGFSNNALTSVEIDPRTLTTEMAAALGSAGVRRASLGVQSFDPRVQIAINRVQSAETTKDAVDMLRANDITGINFDLVYGLPHQTEESCIETVEAALAMRPDRLAVFGYAHVPGFKKHQKLIDESHLADSEGRIAQANAIAATLVAAGYRQIGLDHFALPDDSLSIAERDGTLHRNFQGYTTDPASTIIGFGASSIGRFFEGYVQNETSLADYRERIGRGELATVRGYRLTAEDRWRAAIIERLMCDFAVDVEGLAGRHGFDASTVLANNPVLSSLEREGHITIVDGMLRLEEGHRFMVRVAASAFDAYLDKGMMKFSTAA